MYEPAIIFNSNYIAWFFDPFFGMESVVPPSSFRFYSSIQSVSNILTIFVLFLGNSLLFSYVFSKSSHMSNSLKTNRQFALQVFVICFMVMTTAFFYTYIQYFYAPKWLIFAGSLCYNFSSGAQPFTYFFLNPSLREASVKMFCGCRSRRRNVHTNPAPALSIQPNKQKGMRMNVVDVPEDKQQEAGLFQTIFSFFRPLANNDQSSCVPKDCVYINLHLNKHFQKHANKILYASLSNVTEQSAPGFSPKVVPHTARRATLADVCDDLSFPLQPPTKLPKATRREIGIPSHLRKWAKLELDADVLMSPLELDGADEQTVISTMVFEVDFESKARQLDSFSYCSTSMARDFRKQFINHIFTQGQEVFFEFVSGNVRKRRFTEDPMSGAQQEDEEYAENNMKPTHKVVFAFSVKQLYCVTLGNQAVLKKIKFGILKEDSTIKFVPVKNSTLQMFGRNLTKPTTFTDQLAQNGTDKNLAKPLSKQPLSSSLPRSSLSSMGSTSNNKTAPIPLSQITACPNKDIKLTVIENPEEYPSSSKDHKVVIHPEDYSVADHGANVVLTYGPADNQHQIVVAASNLSTYSSNQIPKGQVAIGRALADDIDLEVGTSIIINQVTQEDNNLTAKHVVVDVSACRNKNGSESQLFHSEEVVKSLKKVMINRFMNLNKCSYVSVEKSNTSDDDMFGMFGGSKGPLLIYKITSISLAPPKESSEKEPKKQIMPDATVSFFGQEEKNGGQLLNFDWNFEKMGIGVWTNNLMKSFAEHLRLVC
uniref:Uncharacterized protein n=1 Tax=Ditylenchus dipsaci TaxID=166011 RepID=A0A915DW12_9BILA